MAVTKNFSVCLFIFFICVGSSLTNQEKKNDDSEEFVPSNEWKEIQPGQKVPSGLHYRINLSTGKKEAKIIEEEDDNDEKTSRNFVIQEFSDEVKSPVDVNEMEEFLKEVNKKDPGKDMPKKFRTLDEIKKDLKDVQLHPKTDVEILKELFEIFDEEEKKKNPDDNVILNIIKDIKHIGHQIDNGNEFYKMDGFRKIIYKKLNSTNPVVKQETLILFATLAQNNPTVKIHILESGGITTLLRILNLEKNENIKKSALTALSCTLRTFPYAQNQFFTIGGLKIFTELFKSESVKLKLKIVTLLSDLIVERQKNTDHFENHELVDIESEFYQLGWCQYLSELLSDLMIIDLSDFDSIEKCLVAMKTVSKCKHSFNKKDLLNLQHQYQVLFTRNNIEGENYYKYLMELIVEILNETSKDEL
ncbi:hypothetical protein ABEB36_009087 [Hypothenemus hampei]|uniref:Nucleotide exchange factor SIL1 n=1 Tax=Hypothenemus hampei TaxID=57062 RepID=A0ABD1ET28_HYPHA